MTLKIPDLVMRYKITTVIDFTDMQLGATYL